MSKRRSGKRSDKTTPQLTYFQRISLFFFKRPRKTALIWLLIGILGAASYTTLLKREGFPAIQTPFAVSQGAYLVNDAQRVDKEVAKPLSEFLLNQSDVESVQTQSFSNFFTATVSYEEGVNAVDRSKVLQQEIKNRKILPEQATGELEAFQFGFTERGDDLVVAFYSERPGVSTEQLASKATQAAEFIDKQNIPMIERVSIINPFEQAVNPSTGRVQDEQKSFDRFAVREEAGIDFKNSIVIGISSADEADQLELDQNVHEALDKLNKDPGFEDYKAQISASNAPQITAQVNELQITLLEGLLAVLVVGSLIIAVRASVITVVSMITVIAFVNALFYAIGYTLNTITLFGLVLALALIVDDTIIMVEAIDAQRRKRRKRDEVVKVATRKVTKAMVAATTTAALSFTPLLFVGGILGEFIRTIPITIISALFISLLVALIIIPFLARYLLLNKKQLGKGNRDKGTAGFEAKIAEFISKPMLWARNSRKKMTAVILVAVLIGAAFVAASGVVFQQVRFSIFPADKDSNQISITLSFPPGTNINEAQNIADEANRLVAMELGQNMIGASYYAQANSQRAMLMIDLIDYSKREVTAPELVDKLDSSFDNFNNASVQSAVVGAGPPPSAFAARVEAGENRTAATKLANDIATYLKDLQLERTDGTTATTEQVIPPNPNAYARDDNKPYVEARAEFNATDTSTLVTLAQAQVEQEFTDSKIQAYGLPPDALTFDFGQESENQDSFRTLALAFPVILVAIYLLLAAQFRSLLQPLLIFVAIPFSLLGITLGLYITDNPFSFFAMLGFFALIGLSIKNTILLTDYANQSRRAGRDPVDAAHEALKERFRPLVATSLTAIVSLIPLSLRSPFWEGLTVVLIFGLLSSTFLVITVFPYYYLATEFLRYRFSRKSTLIWLFCAFAVMGILVAGGFGWIALLAPIVTSVTLYGFKKIRFI